MGLLNQWETNKSNMNVCIKSSKVSFSYLHLKKKNWDYGIDETQFHISEYMLKF
jgi:hypothetical protein